MTPEQLFDLIRQGENSGVEFKRDNLRREQFAQEVVAFANFQGGRILIGVEDNGAVSGIQRDDLEHWVMDTLFGRTVHPQLLPYYETVRLDDCKQVAVVTVLPGTAKPYVVRHNQREDIPASDPPVTRSSSRCCVSRISTLSTSTPTWTMMSAVSINNAMPRRPGS